MGRANAQEDDAVALRLCGVRQAFRIGLGFSRREVLGPAGAAAIR